MTPVGAALRRKLRTHQVYGANTDVGKTIVSTILLKKLSQRGKVGFLKPVSTGPPRDADDSHVNKFTADSNNVITQCLYQFGEPVSPHIAAQSKQRLEDHEILTSIQALLSSWSAKGLRNALIETAGGVHSPGPNSTSQADLYRPLRLPIVLVADSRLGGISSTISAFESLLVRGYDIQSILLFKDSYYKNHEYLESYFSRKEIPLLAFPKPPARPVMNGTFNNQIEDQEVMREYYTSVQNDVDIDSLLAKMDEKCDRSIEELDKMATRAQEAIWYPFTQHQEMKSEDITVIESAYGDYFQTLRPSTDASQNEEDYVLQSTFDASASWWTQGLGHGNPDLALTAAHAAGKYGHVMFAGAIHKPALDLAELLLHSLGNPRLRKVFYSDNGSTGMEVAVKMALRASCMRYDHDTSTEDIKILGLKGSYHGDTIGVMDCSEPSTYNKKVEWYKGRGYWFDFPTVGMKNGKWHVSVPDTLAPELSTGETFDSLNEVFDLDDRLSSEAGQNYKGFIQKTLDRLFHKEGFKFGALVMEPVILGAGGMLFADPLFQRCLVDVVRSRPDLFGRTPKSTKTDTNWSGLPVIFDEVFTGLYRLGRRTSASFLGVDPDISVHAKLLTGGLIPLAVTLASKEIFNVFLTREKSDALLHGHSYTAHPVGCHVAQTSVKMMMDLENQGGWKCFQQLWQINQPSGKATSHQVWSHWSLNLIQDLSSSINVENVFAIGSVLCISMLDETGQKGYTSTAAKGLQQELAHGINGLLPFNVHSRVLGNVLYLMASMNSTRQDLSKIEDLLRRAILA